MSQTENRKQKSWAKFFYYCFEIRFSYEEKNIY